MSSALRACTGFLAFVALAAAGCSSQSGDPNAPYQPTPLGPGLRIAQVSDPQSKSHPTSGVTVNVTGAAVSWVDRFDETMDGKSIGTVYIQDVASTAQYSALSVFSPTYVPADLRVAPGDVLDFHGPYSEAANIGSAVFPMGQILPQLSKPTGTFRYEYDAPTPLVLTDPTVLNDYNKGRPYMWMLVTLQNVQLDALSNDGHGRITGHLTSDQTVNGVVISNENFGLQTTDYPGGTKFASVTGIVTWFFNYHLAPRSAADIVVAK